MGSRAARWLLVVLLLGELLLLSRQASQRGNEGALLSGAAVGMLGPMAHGVTGAERGIGSLGSGFRFRRRVMKENEELRHRDDDLQRELPRVQTIEGAYLRLGEAVQDAALNHQPLQVA